MLREMIPKAEGYETFLTKSILRGCGGHFSLGPHCPERSLRVILLGEDGEEELGEAEEELDQKRLELSSLSVGGLTQPRTMKLQGSLEGKTVLVLVDSGASHNFISKKVVEELELEVDGTKSHPVCLGDGQRKKT